MIVGCEWRGRWVQGWVVVWINSCEWCWVHERMSGVHSGARSAAWSSVAALKMYTDSCNDECSLHGQICQYGELSVEQELQWAYMSCCKTACRLPELEETGNR